MARCSFCNYLVMHASSKSLIHMMLSACLQVVVGYTSQPKAYSLYTPIRRQTVKHIARRSYPMLFADMAKNLPTCRIYMIKAIAKEARKEISKLSGS